jgi:hypothetical protein
MKALRLEVSIGPGVTSQATLVQAYGLWYFKYEGDDEEDWRVFQDLPYRVQDQLLSAVWAKDDRLEGGGTA